MLFLVQGSWVYILECADGSYYTGFTTDPERRINEHNRGIGSKYTASRRPVIILWSVRCRNRREAMSVERRIKRLTRTRKDRLMGLNKASLAGVLAGWRRKRGKRNRATNLRRR
jgi:putative endonuclease